MSGIRNLLLPIEIKAAGKHCKCSHSKDHSIPRAGVRFVRKDPGGMREKGYCAACSIAMSAAA